MRNRRCPFSGTAPAMADVNQQKKQRWSTVYQVGPPQSVSLYLCGWTGSQRHFCRRVLMCGTGRAHLFSKIRIIIFNKNTFLGSLFQYVFFLERWLKPCGAQCLNLQSPVDTCMTWDAVESSIRRLGVISAKWAMESCEDQAIYWVQRMCPCLLMQQWLVSGASLNKGEWQR